MKNIIVKMSVAFLEAENIPITLLDWIEPTLEDVFISAVNANHVLG